MKKDFKKKVYLGSDLAVGFYPEVGSGVALGNNRVSVALFGGVCNMKIVA